MTIENDFKVLSPTAILGYGFPVESFKKGMDRKPNLIAVDAGSTDPGPYYLGSGKSFTNRINVKRDLRIMITQGIKENIPVVIGTGGGSGAKPHVDWCYQIIEEIAQEEKLSFKLGIIFADINKDLVIQAFKQNKISPLSFVPELTEEDILATENIVAQMGVEPIQKALKKKCDVILCGRCYDPAVFAALPISLGFDAGLAMHMGKILECAAIAATPGSGSDSVLGILKKDSFILEPLSNKRKFTKESTAAHTLYEKSNPYTLAGPGGVLDLKNCSFSELKGGRTEVKGSAFVPSKEYFIKLEGAKKIGYRTISIAGTRDPIMISSIDDILKKIEKQIYEILRNEGIDAKIFFHIYGKNGVMKDMEPEKEIRSHELGLIIDVMASTEADSAMACSLTRSTLLHYGYPGRISTAGNLAFPFSPSDINAGEVYEFSIYHLMKIDDQNIFKIKTKLFDFNN